MAAEEAVDSLKLFWDHFFKAETGTYEKSTWLDLFLAEFLIRINDGANPKELINFCPVSGVVTLVGCELLCGIHRVTSSINTHHSTPLPPLETSGTSSKCTVDSPDGEAKPAVQSASLFARANAQSSEEILKKYLLGGVAWRCLLLLRALGVEGLSCCRQLSSVLIWLFGELGCASATATASIDTAGSVVPATASVARTPIHQLFSHRIWAKQKPPGSKQNSVASSEKSSLTPRSRHTSQLESPEGRGRRRGAPRTTPPSSESADSTDDLQLLNRSLAIVKVASNDDFHYYNSSIRSSNDYPDSYASSFASPRKTRPKADDYMTEKHKQIINSEIGAFEFTLIITDLLQELCKAESSLSGSEGSQISMQCINFSLRNLCSLQFGSSATQEHAQHVSRIKVALTELLIVSLDKVLVHSDLCAKLINNGILPMLLRILEDVITKNNKTDTNRIKETYKTECENSLQFVFGVAYSVTAFFHCLLMQCRSVDKLREFTDQFKLYGECLKGGLLKDCIHLMARIPNVDDDYVVVLIKKLIESLGKLINGMKRVRSEVIHSAACPRARHKACRARVAAGMHHHHDILGEAGAGPPLPTACCVSVLYGTLASLLTDDEVAAKSVLRHKILRVMLNCGVCCCFAASLLMESIVRLMLTHNTAAALCLQVLEHAVYGELGASILVASVTDRLPCSVCEPCDERKDVAGKLCHHPAGPADRKSVWSFLIHYNSLLQLDNHTDVLHATVAHLLRVTPRCRQDMKYELLFSVIYPTFIVAKHRYIIRMEEPAYFLTVSCLNIFASLLNTVPFAEQFIQKGGLSYVLELVSLPEFSNQCCSILEIAIVVEIFKLMKENSEMAYYREMSSLSSVQMLFKSLAEVTDRCYKIYELKLPKDKYEELIDVSEESEALGFMAAPSLERQASTPIAIKTAFAHAENTTEYTIEDHLETLKSVWTFWKTCAGLCLYSPVFRAHVAAARALLDSYALLRLTLHALCDLAPPAQHARLLIKIMEALLTVQLAVGDVTGGQSKDRSCALVRNALVAPPANVLEGGGLRALCEALVRVATAEPSRRHAMPAPAIPKVPPLLCPSGSSAECSSSEESAAAVYASEHSDAPTTRPDEGYEADVEIGKFDLLPPFKNRKMSTALSSITANMTSPQIGSLEGIAEWAEYNRRGELAHPELCIIVVDILTHLIDKLLKSKRSNGEAGGNISRVGASLARACMARLAGALAGGRPPPRLLHRLLAGTKQETPAARLLSCKDDQLEDLQRSILELIHVLASQSMEASELAALLRLFTAESPPLGMLLVALQRLAVAAQHHTPDCILTFPVDLELTDNVQPLSDDFVHLTLNGVSSQSHIAETSALKLHQAHLRAGIWSVWSCGAARCGVEGAGWAPWLAGFSAVLWLHAPPPPQETPETPNGDTSEAESESKPASKTASKSPSHEPRLELSHVLSLGHDSLMFEMWLDTQTGELTFRLTRPEATCNRVLSSARSSRGIAAKRWSCVALNVRERVLKRLMYIQVTMFIDGYECETVSLPIQGILVRKVTPTHIVLGHARAPGSGPTGVYHLACASVYRTPLLTPYYAMHISAHGPDSSCMVRCESPNYPSLLTPDILDLNIDWDQVYEMSSSSLRELHENLLLTFSASAPTIVNLYHHTAPLPPVFSSRVPTPGMMSGGSQGGGGAPIPEALWARWAGAPLPSRHRGFTPALYMLQGVEVLLYLYARVVELDGSAVEQAMALGILLRACRVDNRLYSSFHSEEVPDMLLTVFAAPRCQLTPHLLKVILDEACSAPILRCSGGVVQVAARSDAVLLEPALLVLLARAAERLDNTKEFTWEVEGCASSRMRQRGSLWALALCSMRVLLRAAHPRRAFNHYQMSRPDLLHHLLLACKERFLNSESGPMEPCASESLVELVRGLTGSPPAPHRLALLCDFLLLMHQASDTFVTHSRANFYFLLTSETQEMSEFSTITKRRTSKRIRRRSNNQPEISSASTEDVTIENSLYIPKDMVQSREGSEKMESSIDSTKQLKGILNMQLKEGRKHTTSSTSDNSDTTADPEPAEGSEGSDRAATNEAESGIAETETDGGITTELKLEAPENLQEYIVVDEDDVNHTTVEMYSSGIYHQGRVRTGASPDWAACEGLLLLLRDTIAVLPDHTLHQVIGGAVQAESVLVLANHRSAGVRAAVVRVLCALQRRAHADLARKYYHAHYYIHLANQISLYEGSWELATACAALITKCDVPLEDQLDDDIWVDVSEESLQRCPPLLAMLPCCLHDVPLAHNITRIIDRIIDKAPLKLITEVSLIESVVRGIRALGVRAGEWEGRDLLLVDLYSLLERLAVKSLRTQTTMQTIIDMHHLLSYVEQVSSPDEGAVVRAVRAAQAQLYTAQIDYLEDKLHSSYTDQSKQGNYFANVLTSAVSLGGGGGVAGWSRGELGARLASTVSRAVAYILTQHPCSPLGEHDAALLDRLLHMLPTAVSGSQHRPKWWVGSAEWAAPLQELAGWALAGGGDAGVAALRALYRAPEPALHQLAPDPPHMRKLAVYLLMILKSIHGAGEEGPPPVEYAITDWARGWALALQAGLPERLAGGALPLEAAACLRRDLERWARAANRQAPHIAKVVWSKESLAGRVSESAMAVTRSAVEAQNAERKRFMEHLRSAQARAAAAMLAWERLVDTHTHKQGVWHSPRSYPAAWALDPTEGPGRVRVRLRRAHLNIHPKFLKPQYRYKAETLSRGGPLRSVLGGGGGARGGLVTRLQLNETVAYMARAVCVTVAAETQGELLLSDRSIHFVPDDVEEEKEKPSTNARKRDKQYNQEIRAPAQSWPLESVVQVVTRRWCLREVAVELFLSSGHAHLLAFAGPAERAAFLKALQGASLPAKIEPDTLSEAMSQWRSGAITNWEYLMRLNGLGGRSYNDLMQYPVLPFVIADYTSRILDLAKPEVFRDLSRPMAVQNKNREQHYIKIYNDLKAAHREGSSPLVARAPHHYASLYSNSGGVLHYLVRLPPFTELFLNYQDNNFDMPDRTFHSLQTTWRLITNDSPTDVKELIPELFYLPELFHNNEGLNLGVRQCGAAIDNVELPAWAADARLFTLAHRQALEARHVTEMLPHWLDLVFGYKQTGQPALDAINVFPACTYYGFDPDSLEDENDRTAAADMVRLYGQAPRQLLRTPHPSVQPNINAQAQLETGVFAGVSGVRWGRYCGSPALAPPAAWSRRAVAGACSLHSLGARAVAAVTHATALQALPATGDSASQSGTGPALGLVSWGHSDNIVRIKRRRDAPPDLLLHTPALDQITKVSSSSSTPSCPLFIGHASGRVLAVRVRTAGAGMAPRVRTRALLAHNSPITAVYASVKAALLLTASQDGAIVLWDLNKLSYIRKLPNRDSAPVTHGTVSDTLCDVATVHTPLLTPSSTPTGGPAAPQQGALTPTPPENGDADADAADEYEKDAAYKYKSLIRVHTCNATFVGSVKVLEEVTCIVYSSVPEGVSVNCIAAGLKSGGVRLYSSWDLRPTVYVPPAGNAPLTCLAFSSDCMVLFGCYEGGAVVAWEPANGTRPPPVKVHPAHALL